MQISTVFAGALGGCLLVSSSLAVASGAERIWQHSILGGATEYVILHGEAEAFTVDTITEAPGALPRKTSTHRFNREAEALRFAESEAGPRALVELFEDSTPAHSSPSVTTEVSGVSLWAVTQSWSWDWELRYDQWVKDQVTHDFFIENQILTDCADVAYALRWIFARIHGLPAANHLAGSGVLFTQDSMQAEWLKLPVDADWRKDQRFRAALVYLLDLTFTHSLLRDSYPIEISVTSLIRGTHHLEIHGSSGHTLFVYRTDYADTTTQPLEVMYSNLPKIVRELYHNGYWRQDQPKEGEGGFLRMRWPLRAPTELSGWELASPESHPYFSREQFQPELMKDRSSFAEAVLVKLSPKLDFVQRLKEGIAYLKEQLKMREGVVSQGFEVCQRTGCPEKSQEFEDWSTFSRDARFREVYTQLELLVQNLSHQIPKLRSVWDAAMADPSVTVEGETYSLGEAVFAWKSRAYSSDPRLSVATRWGLAPLAYASALARKIDQRLVERDQRITAQASRCAAPGACSPTSNDWTAWNTFDIDEELGMAADLLSGYCNRAPEARCQAMLAARDTVQAGATIGRPMSIAKWESTSAWLVSDPRASIDVRWGAHRAGRSSYSFSRGRDFNLMISASGLAGTYTQPMAMASPFSHDVQYSSQTLYDLPGGHEILPPAGMSWYGFDPKSDRAIALPATLAEGAALSLQVIEPRSGDKVFEAGGYTSVTDFTAFWISPGILWVGAPGAKADLFDLGVQPVFEARGLPPFRGSFLVSPFLTWIGSADNENFELLAYRNGKIHRDSLKGVFGPGERPLFLSSAGGDFVMGGYVYCASPTCNQNEYRGSFTSNLRTGKTQVKGGVNNAVMLMPDGKWGAGIEYGADPKVELLEFGPGLEVLSRRKIGVSVVRTQGEYGTFMQGTVKDDAGVLRLFRYGAGAWLELALLSDEKELLDFDGDFVQTLTQAGGHRVRRFGGSQAIFESEPGTELMLVGTRDEGKVLPAVVVTYPGEHHDQAFFELDRPSSPLVTGRFIKPRDRALPGGMQFFRPEETLVAPRGFLLPVGMATRLWIDSHK
jgi:hypothetical protein